MSSSDNEKRRGGGLLATGIVLMALVAPVILGLGIWLGVDRATSMGSTGAPLRPGETRHLEAGHSITVSGVPDPTADGPGRTGAECSVTGPSGPVHVTPGYSTGSSTAGGSDGSTSGSTAGATAQPGSVTLASFTTGGAGDYRVTCTGYEEVTLFDSTAMLHDVGWFLGGLWGGILLGGLVGLVGLILLVVGIVQLTRRPRRPAPAGWVTYQ